jgi:hypothetical protein
MFATQRNYQVFEEINVYPDLGTTLCVHILKYHMVPTKTYKLVSTKWKILNEMLIQSKKQVW